MEKIIAEKLTAALTPTHLEVKNESHKHAGHAGDDGTGQTHFRVVVVSDKFDGLSRVARQRLVMESLATEMANQIHALSIQAKTPAEA